MADNLGRRKTPLRSTDPYYPCFFAFEVVVSLGAVGIVSRVPAGPLGRACQKRMSGDQGSISRPFHRKQSFCSWFQRFEYDKERVGVAKVMEKG